MKLSSVFFVLCLLHFVGVGAKERASGYTVNKIENCEALCSFYEKLEAEPQSLEILHIGDSHIQANFMTGYVREKLQSVYGDGGRGFVFPYRLARTNGVVGVHFYSDVAWKRHRIITKDAVKVGVSGYNVYTKANRFFLQLKVEEDIAFSEVVLRGKGLADFRCGIPKINIKPPKPVYDKVVYRVKSGDVLGKIARKFRVSIKNIKLWNHLRSDLIRIGQRLRILKKNSHTAWKLNSDDFEWVEPLEQTDSVVRLITSGSVQELFFAKVTESRTQSDVTEIHSCLLKKSEPGVVYHSIGVNGAKFTDFNQSAKFFSELGYFTPDLVVISIGTNEAFDRFYPLASFEQDLKKFCERVKENTGCQNILLTTPPSALIRKHYTNKKLPDYAHLLKKFAETEGYAVWDLYAVMQAQGGMRSWYKKGWAAKDRIHFTQKGYRVQGELLYDALIDRKCSDE